MKKLLAAILALVCFAGLAIAHGGHQGNIPDLKTAPPSHQVVGIEYCNGSYHVKFRDGSTFDYKEFDLRFKTDSGPNGPLAGAPVQVSAGMRGDRAFLLRRRETGHYFRSYRRSRDPREPSSGREGGRGPGTCRHLSRPAFVTFPG